MKFQNFLVFLFLIKNPWCYSPEEPRTTEVAAARWQYGGLVVRKEFIPQP